MTRSGKLVRSVGFENRANTSGSKRAKGRKKMSKRKKTVAALKVQSTRI